MSQQYVRMLIGECLSMDKAVKEFANKCWEHVQDLPHEAGFVGAEILTEEGGAMVIFSTKWETSEDCFRYNASRAYRQFVAATQHLLVGNVVIKVFASSGAWAGPRMVRHG